MALGIVGACARAGPCEGPVVAGDVMGMLDAVDVSAGVNATCALRAGGSVACWGRDWLGQLGDGDAVDRDGPTEVVGITDAVEVAMEGVFACARQRSGGVLCWGSNAGGTLATDLVPHCTCTGPHCLDSFAPVAAGGITDAVQLAVGQTHVCVLHVDGTVSCWGVSGALGDGLAVHEPCAATSLSSVPVTVVDLSDAVEITQRCARRATGAVVCWGGLTGDGTNGFRLGPVPVQGLEDAVEITSGLGHSCARRASGSVVCWGNGVSGQLGDGAGVTALAPVEVVGLSDALEISAGGNHTCARRATDVVCWGANSSGQLGDGTATAHETPTPVVGVGEVAHVSAGYAHTCVVTTSGGVSCWGGNYCGELGDGTRVTRGTPADVVTR